MSPRLAVVVAYFAILVVLGVIASRRICDVGDYYVGGKRLHAWVVALSTQATGESGWLLLGLTGLGALVGAQALWVVAGELLGVALAWFVVAPPFKRATDAAGAITVPDWLVARFTTGSEHPLRRATLRALAAGTIAVFVTVYVSAQIDATGKAVESFLDWNYYYGASIGFGVVALYCWTGGFVAVAWTDTLQGVLMFAGLLLLPLVALTAPQLDAGVGTVLAAVTPGFTSLWGPGGPGLEGVLVAVSFAAIGLGFLGAPQIVVRFMSASDEAQLRRGRWIALAFTLCADVGAVATGMLGRRAPGAGRCSRHRGVRYRRGARAPGAGGDAVPGARRRSLRCRGAGGHHVDVELAARARILGRDP